MALSKRLTAEFIGTLWLVLGGCGSAVLAAAFPNVGIGLLRSLSCFRFDCPNYGIRGRSRLRLPSQPGRFFRLVGG